MHEAFEAYMLLRCHFGSSPICIREHKLPYLYIFRTSEWDPSVLQLNACPAGVILGFIWKLLLLPDLQVHQVAIGDIGRYPPAACGVRATDGTWRIRLDTSPPEQLADYRKMSFFKSAVPLCGYRQTGYGRYLGDDLRLPVSRPRFTD